MKVSIVNPNNQRQQYQPNFKSIIQRVNNPLTGRFHRNNSYIFRNDLNWRVLTDCIIEKGANVPKMNLHSLACSNGSEPYSLAMLLMAKLGDKAKKFFPIIASDFDEAVIARAKTGTIILDTGTNHCGYNEVSRIEQITGEKIGRFMRQSQIDLGDQRQFKINKTLKDAVEFNQGNLLDEVDKITPENSIVMIRNVWPYLRKEEVSELIRKLTQKIKRNSMLIVGDYDTCETGLSSVLRKAGFRGNLQSNCFENSTHQ